AEAHGIAALLERGGGRVVLSCRYARSFVPGLFGAWLAGATVELLPNVSPGTLDRVDVDPEVAYVLHDDAGRQDRSPKAIYVPGVPRTAPDARAPAPPIAETERSPGHRAKPEAPEQRSEGFSEFAVQGDQM